MNARKTVGGLLLMAAFAFHPDGAEANAKALVHETCLPQQTQQGEQRKTNCSGAKDTYRAKQTNTATSAVWSGVSAICMHACVNRHMTTTCTYAAPGGSAAEGALTKNFISGLQPVAERVAGKVGNLGSKGAQAVTDTVPVPPTSGGGLSGAAEPCKAASTSMLSAVKQYRAASSHQERLEQFRENGQKLDQKQGTSTVKFGADGATSGSAAVRGGSTIITQAPECEEENLKTAAAYLSCAAKMNPELPRGLASEQFLKDLEKATGKSADRFFAEFKDPASSIFGSLPSGMTDAQKQALVNSYREMNQYAKANLGSGGAYASLTGGKGAVEAPSEDLDLNGVLSQLMGPLGEGGESGNTAPSGVNTADFGANRAPAMEISAEDRSFSIFDRVKIRYSKVSRKFHLGERP